MTTYKENGRQYSENTVRNWYNTYVKIYQDRARNNSMSESMLSFSEYKGMRRELVRAHNETGTWGDQKNERERVLSSDKTVNEILVRHQMTLPTKDTARRLWVRYQNAVIECRHNISDDFAMDWLQRFGGFTFSDLKKEPVYIMKCVDELYYSDFYNPSPSLNKYALY